MRHLPTSTYSGLTVVLSQPSRKDQSAGYLISGYAGIEFNEALQKYGHGINRNNCDIRTADTLEAGLLNETKAILLLGEMALRSWCVQDRYKDYTVSEIRGTPLLTNFNLPTLVSFAPQDCCDSQDYEGKFNPLLQGNDEDDEKGEEDAITTKGRRGHTRRSNYLFWLQRDIHKICNRLYGVPTYDSSKFIIRLYPAFTEIYEALTTTQNEDFFFDIETDSDRNLTAIGFSFSGSNNIYSFPILDYNYNLFYGPRNTYRILWAISRALLRNRAVIHNCMFDLFVLLWKYRIFIGMDIYDTMLAQARCYPLTEKSLGHALSCWPNIWEQYHKDEGIFEPRNQAQMHGLVGYNAKDVLALRLIKRAHDEFAASDIGLMDSIAQANSAPYAFILNTLRGIHVDEEGIRARLLENDRLLTHYMRAIAVLTGFEMNPSSPKQCISYFHDMMRYPVVNKTAEGAPSLKGESMYKLKLQNPLNAVIDFVLRYREIKTMSGHLKAQPLPEHINL